VITPLRRSGMVRVLEDLSFTCTRRVHPLTNEPNHQELHSKKREAYRNERFFYF